VLPYFKSKLHSIYNKEREARLQASLCGNGDETVEDAEYFSGGDASLVSGETLDAEATIRARLTKKIQKIVFSCYPWLHASSEGNVLVLS
jgi:peroxin-12